MRVRMDTNDRFCLRGGESRCRDGKSAQSLKNAANVLVL